MIKYLCKSVEDYRFEREQDMDDFEREVRKDAADRGYNISGFNKSHKETKTDEYWVAKVTRVFNKPTNILMPISGVQFDFVSNAELPWNDEKVSF